MTVSIVANEHRQAAVDVVTPTAQVTTNTETVVTGSNIDARPWRSIAYTAVNETASPANTVQWSVYVANKSDFSDEVAVQALTDIANGAAAKYAETIAAYSYYRVKVKSKNLDSAGTVTVRGIAKG